MRTVAPLALAVCLSTLSACAPAAPPVDDTLSDPAMAMAEEGTLAQVYYWKAKPGKFDEYTRYIREHAEPIDGAAQQGGAFVSVTTYMTQDTLSPWTHMRIFVLRDSAQLEGLSAALTAAGVALEPDSVKRREASEYSATLRDGVGSATVEILR